jgi:hypothetical protein
VRLSRWRHRHARAATHSSKHVRRARLNRFLGNARARKAEGLVTPVIWSGVAYGVVAERKVMCL